MQEAAQLALLDQVWQPVAGGRFQLAGPLAQLGRHPREAEGAVHARLVGKRPGE